LHSKATMTDGSTGDASPATMTSAEKTPDTTPTGDPTSRMYMLVFERGSSWVFELPRQGEIVIGRGELAELRLRDHAVSRRHAIVDLRAHGIVLRDLGSHNGTFVNGERITSDHELHNGDSIAVCAATLVLYTSAPAHTGSRWLVTYSALRERFE